MSQQSTDSAVKMIATDIDGTMIRSDGSLSKRVRDALHDAHAAGIHVVPATGRPVSIADDVIRALDLPHYWVFANGAVTRHLGRDELVRGFWMDVALTTRLVQSLREKLPDAGFAIEFESTVAFEPSFSEVVPILPEVAATGDVLSVFAGVESVDPSSLDSAELHSPYQRVQKVLVYDLSLELDQLYADVTHAVGTEAVASYSGLSFVELAASEVTKATALQLLSDDLGIDRSEVACFGDNHNDLPMLQWAGRSFAMANGTEDVHAAAHEIIGPNDEDGLAHKVEELLS